MEHRYNLYVNQGDRRIPSLVEQGNIDLRCSNPDAQSYRHEYDAERLWRYLQSESDMSQHGLYLSLYSTEQPTYDGKRWFVRTAYNDQQGGMHQTRSLEVRWVDVKNIQFWNTSFRDYARIHQSRGIVDYSVYISRAFGYAFMVGTRWDDDEDEERGEFTNFYPSIHHYHKTVAVDEQATYQMFNGDLSWFPKNYSIVEMDDESEPEDSEAILVEIDGSVGIASAVEQATESMRSWGEVLATDNDGGLDLADILESSQDMLPEIEEPIEDEADSEDLIDLGEDIMEEEED